MHFVNACFNLFQVFKAIVIFLFALDPQIKMLLDKFFMGKKYADMK